MRWHTSKLLWPWVLLPALVVAGLVLAYLDGRFAPANSVTQQAALLENQDPERRREAAINLGKLGPAAAEAVPALGAVLEDRDQKVRLAAAEALGKIGAPAEAAAPELRAAVKHDPNHLVRGQAALVLHQIGAETDGQLLAPALVGVMGDPFIGVEASRALADLGPKAAPAIPNLIQLLERRPRHLFAVGGSMVHYDAIIVLGKIGPAATVAIPDLVAVAADIYGTDRQRDQTVKALKQIDPHVLTVKRLQPLLNEPREDVRAGAARLLGKIGPSARAALPALREALQDKYSHVRVESALALWRVDRTDREGVPVLVSAFLSGDLALKLVTKQALVEMGPDAREAVPDLLAHYRKLSSDLFVQARAEFREVLQAIDPKAVPADR